MDRRTLIKLLTVTALLLGYLLIAAFDFHREVIAPVIVLAIAVALFIPFGGRTSKPVVRRARTDADGPTRSGADRWD